MRPCFLLRLYYTKHIVAHTFSCIVFAILQSCLCQYVKERFRKDPDPIRDRQRRYSGRLISGEVENNGFEPLTPCLQSRCSSQLS